MRPSVIVSETLNTAYLNGCFDRWKNGDLSGRDSLIQAAAGRLEPLARKMLRAFPNVRRWEETNDVLQNAIIRLLRTLESIRPASTRDFLNLAVVHIRRELLDLARHHKNRANQMNASPGSDANLDPMAQIPEKSPEGTELDRWCAFHDQVEKLPAEEREVVGLIFYHGWTQAQVAELFDISDRTVRRRWEDAMKKLHSTLGTGS
jgi:RNA polymerase sigma-70 factor (ECF subfamily)